MEEEISTFLPCSDTDTTIVAATLLVQLQETTTIEPSLSLRRRPPVDLSRLRLPSEDWISNSGTTSRIGIMDLREEGEHLVGVCGTRLGGRRQICWQGGTIMEATRRSREKEEEEHRRGSPSDEVDTRKRVTRKRKRSS